MTTLTANNIDSSRIEVVPRKEFLKEWGYQGGQHLTMLGPTQRGKTTLAIQLLGSVISHELPCVIFAGKPPGRDKTMAAAAEKLNLRIVEEWPPAPNFGDKKRNGFVLRPRQTLTNIDRDNANLREQYRKALIANYSSTKSVITVLDEAHHVQNDLKLLKEYEAPLMRGAPINAVWSLIQRGRYMSYQAYAAPEHIFMFYDPDKSNRERYSEIGGIDPRQVEYILSTLKTYTVSGGQTISEALYIRRSGPRMAIVDVK